MSVSAPTETELHGAALRHLARYATSVAGLSRVLERRIERWRRAALEEGLEVEAADAAARASKLAVGRILERLQHAGALDDRRFGATRAGRLTRAGRSRAAIASSLTAKGLAAEGARRSAAEAQPDAETELAAALVLARRKRAGPWDAAADPKARLRVLASFARAGFGRSVAERALAMDRDEAEARIAALRR